MPNEIIKYSKPTRRVLKCSECGHEVTVYQKYCPVCWKEKTIQVIEIEINDKKSIDGIIPEMKKHFQSGSSFFDDFTPGGIPEGAKIVIYGQPGTRKSFCSLEWASCFVQKGIDCYYFSNEMSPSLVNSYVETLGIHKFSPPFFYQENDINIHRVIKEKRPKIIFLDSFQKIRKDSVYNRKGITNDELIHRINIWASQYKCIIFIISHKLIPAALEHDVDIVIKCEQSKHDDTTIKFYSPRKNRLIQNSESVIKYFGIGDTGFTEVNPPKANK